MSYIRCLSNPDDCYCYHDVNGSVYISTKETIKQGIKNGKFGVGVFIPAREFYGLVKKFHTSWDTEVKWGQFSIKECKGFRKYQLTYKDQSFKLWQVTWHYIVQKIAHQRNWK
jgi:hypothetical protein